MIRRHIPNASPITNFKVKLIGLSLAAEIIKQEIQRSKGSWTRGKAFILCDKEGALRKVADPEKKTLGQYLSLTTHYMLKAIQEEIPVNLLWCPSHSGIEGNELADEVAKKAAENYLIQHYLMHPSISKLNQLIRSKNKNPKLTNEEQQQFKFKGTPRLLLIKLNKLERAHTSVIHQLQSAHSMLNDHLFQIRV
ncbi:hypothetical protein O181_038729 [Austropuccinia psidii MF-1]|uniref:RNase H type-1 domain-containing protein n=1 Tax=Austropuccinia psidii MF-1 TaxID=1389203 RepID=A0A9Q3HDU9_9BASI|nr:hypothetical protein [Austropuccinia psidii MF-1]